MVLRKLDQADVQIKSMLDILRETVVDPALGHATASTASTSSVAIQEHKASPLASAQKTLHHFIDETASETILASFHLSIDEVADATKSLALTIATFTSVLESIASVLTAVDKVVVISQGSSEFGAHLGNAKPNKNGREQKLDLPATAAMYQEMEEHATEMAILVQGLMTHYELCVKALRHTDGGSEIVAQEQAGIERSIEGSSQDFMIDMSPHERVEMLLVLSHDASELEDVTSEIGDRLADMESLHTHIICASDAVEQSHDELKAAVVQMTEVQEKLALYIEAGAIFDRRWKEQKEEILAKMEELEGLRSFYGGFVRAYEGLVQEVARRDGIREKVDRVMKEAMRKAERLYEGMLVSSEHKLARTITYSCVQFYNLILTIHRRPSSTRDFPSCAWRVFTKRHMAESYGCAE
jgi:autophagy-related protein 17